MDERENNSRMENSRTGTRGYKADRCARQVSFSGSRVLVPVVCDGSWTVPHSTRGRPDSAYQEVRSSRKRSADTVRRGVTEIHPEAEEVVSSDSGGQDALKTFGIGTWHSIDTFPERNFRKAPHPASGGPEVAGAEEKRYRRRWR